jgi:ankyrin repeat protein
MKLPALVCLLFLTAIGAAQTIPTIIVHSAEAIVVEADRIVIGKVEQVAPKPWPFEVTIKSSETLLGSPILRESVVARSLGQDLLKNLIQEQSLVLVASKAPRPAAAGATVPRNGATLDEAITILNLSDPKVFVTGADFRPITGAAAIIKRFKELIARSDRRSAPEMVDLPPGPDDPPLGQAYGSRVLLRVPVVDPVLNRIRADLRSNDHLVRLRGLDMLARLKTPKLQAEVKRLLADPFKMLSANPAEGFGDEIFAFPVRARAYEVLSNWGFAVTRPVVEERIWKGDALTSAENLGRPVTDEDLERLLRAPRLESLALENTPLTPSQFMAIAKLRSVKKLSLRGAVFDETAISSLVSMPRLASLVLFGARFSDEGLKRLTQLPSLRTLDIRGTQVTGVAVFNFQKARPDVSVQWDGQANRPRPWSSNPLHWAAYSNDLANARALLDKDPSLLNSVDDDHRTALHYAAASDALEVTQVLLEKGADANRQSRVGVTPLMWAMEFNANRVAMLLIQSKTDLELARQDGVAVALPNGNRAPLSFTAMTAAIYDGKPELALAMIERGANVHRKNELQWTPLMLAVQAKLPQIVTVLLDRGADINAQNLDGDAALHLAAKLGDKPMMQLLLGRGADPFAKNDAGQIAFDLIAK